MWQCGGTAARESLAGAPFRATLKHGASLLSLSAVVQLFWLKVSCCLNTGDSYYSVKKDAESFEEFYQEYVIDDDTEKDLAHSKARLKRA